MSIKQIWNLTVLSTFITDGLHNMSLHYIFSNCPSKVGMALASLNRLATHSLEMLQFTGKFLMYQNCLSLGVCLDGDNNVQLPGDDGKFVGLTHRKLKSSGMARCKGNGLLKDVH